MSAIRDRFYKWYWAVEKRLIPTLATSQFKYHKAIRSALPPQPAWLDLGCGHQIFAEWMLREETELAARARCLVGIDLDLSGMLKHQTIHARVMGNLEALPFPAETFDFVTANMVVEHMEKPAAILAEIRRVLQPGGTFVFHTPNFRSPLVRLASMIPGVIKNRLIPFLEDRRAEDIFPTLYRMNTAPTIVQMARQAGFEVENLILTSSSASTVMLGPLVLIELLWLRLIERESLKELRTNIIGVLKRT